MSVLSDAAWLAFHEARTYGGTRVGAAALDHTDQVFAGCNVEHRFRAHDIHAEVNALGNLVTYGSGKLDAIMIVSTAGFTPCGSCMDWIFELGGPHVEILTQRDPNGPFSGFLASELMPHYPLEDD